MAIYKVEFDVKTTQIEKLHQKLRGLSDPELSLLKGIFNSATGDLGEFIEERINREEERRA